MSVIQIWIKKKQDTFQLLHGTVGQVKTWKIRKNQRLFSQNSKSVKKQRAVPKIHGESVFVRMTGISRDAPGMSKPQTMCNIILLEALLWPLLALFGLEASSHSWDSLMLLQPFYTSRPEDQLSSIPACPGPDCWKANSRELKWNIKLCCCILELQHLWRISRNILDFNSRFYYGIYLHKFLLI